MKKSRSSISKARSYAEIGEFWDEHDLSDFWGKTRKVRFDVVVEPEATYYPIEGELSDKIQSVARRKTKRKERIEHSGGRGSVLQGAGR